MRHSIHIFGGTWQYSIYSFSMGSPHTKSLVNTSLKFSGSSMSCIETPQVNENSFRDLSSCLNSELLNLLLE